MKDISTVARQVIKSRSWRWMRGMRFRWSTGGRWYHGTIVGVEEWAIHAVIEGWRGKAFAKHTLDGDRMEPILDDPATMGCMMRLCVEHGGDGLPAPGWQGLARWFLRSTPSNEVKNEHL